MIVVPPRTLAELNDVDESSLGSGENESLLLWDRVRELMFDSGIPLGGISMNGHHHSLEEIDDAGTSAAYDTGVTEGTIPLLETGGKLNVSVLPSLARVDFLGAVANEAAMLALVGESGDWCFRTDTDTEWRLLADDPSDIDSWREVQPLVGVQSWNGLTGSVSVTTTNLPEGTNQYFTASRVIDALNGATLLGPITFNNSPNGAVLTIITASGWVWRADAYAGPQPVTARNPNGWDNDVVILGFRGWNGVSGVGGSGFNWGLHFEPAWDNTVSGINFEWHLDYQDKNNPGVGIRPIAAYLTMLPDGVTFSGEFHLHSETYVWNNSTDTKAWMLWSPTGAGTGLDLFLYNTTNIRHKAHGAWILYGRNAADNAYNGLIKATNVAGTDYVAVGSDTDAAGIAVVMRGNNVFPASADSAYVCNAPNGFSGNFFMGFVNGTARVQISSSGAVIFGNSSSAASVTAFNHFIAKGSNGGYTWTRRDDAAFGNRWTSLVSGNTSLRFYSWDDNSDRITMTQGGVFTHSVAAIAATRGDGIVLYGGSGSPSSITLATSGVPVQMSPSFRLHGEAWKSNATAVSQAHDWTLDVLPVTGAASTTSSFRFGVSVAGGAYSYVATLDNAGKLTLSDNLVAANHIETVGITIDGGGSVITTGSKGHRQVQAAGTIVGYTLLADQSGSIQITVKKATYSGWPTTTSIVASAPPALSSVQKTTDSTLTGWTTAVAANDILEFVVDSATTVTRVTLLLKVKRT
jgi:hypothetical protein